MQAEAGDESIDRPELHAMAATAIAQRRGFDMIFPIRDYYRQNREALDDGAVRLWAAKALTATAGPWR